MEFWELFSDRLFIIFGKEWKKRDRVVILDLSQVEEGFLSGDVTWATLNVVGKVPEVSNAFIMCDSQSDSWADNLNKVCWYRIQRTCSRSHTHRGVCNGRCFLWLLGNWSKLKNQTGKLQILEDILCNISSNLSTHKFDKVKLKSLCFSWVIAAGSESPGKMTRQFVHEYLIKKKSNLHCLKT